jgi:hypothetical protein
MNPRFNSPTKNLGNILPPTVNKISSYSVKKGIHLLINFLFLVQRRKLRSMSPKEAMQL